MPYNADLEIVCGNDVLVPVQLYDGDDGTTPLDLTSVSAIEYIVRRHLNPARRRILRLTMAANTIAVSEDPTDGQIELLFGNTATLPLTGRRIEGYFNHELLITDGAGNKSTVFQGQLTVSPTGA